MPVPLRASALALGVFAVAVSTLILRSASFGNPTTVALAFLLIVLFVAALGRLWAAIVTSLVAVLAFNYFFLPPVGTWHVADPQNLIALGAFVVASIVASQLSATARARAEEAGARRREAEIARERAALSSALLAALGHDLRTPLTALRVAVANLSSRTLSAEARDTQADLARGQAEHLTRLFDEILDMARIESRSIRAEPVWCVPSEIVETAIALVQPSLGIHRLAIDVIDAFEVNVDPRLTASALAHLIENAARYSPADTSIAIMGSAEGERLVITVADEGPGLEQSEIHQLFTPLYRGTAGRTVPSGTGMGLAITRGLLAAEGGSVRAEHGHPRGARFIIEVPAQTRPTQAEQTI